MKSFWALLCLAVVAAIPSCVSDTGIRIPDGVYREPSRSEVVTVKGKDIEFRLRMPKGEGMKGKVLTRSYDYDVETDGKILVGASSSDSFWVFGIEAYDWFWDGKRIIRKKRHWEGDYMNPQKKYSETVIFAAEAAR
jgi:hypothetical protein